MTRLKIEAQCAAASNDWSRHDSLAEKVELQEQELGVLAMSLRDDKCASDIDNSNIFQLVQHRIKRMKKTIIK